VLPSALLRSGHDPLSRCGSQRPRRGDRL
jgi:hypothetical protein